MGVRDKRILGIIKEMLKAGYIESELFHNTDTGTVQGGIISPLLANVYLTSFDWMIGRMYLYPKQRRCKYLESDRRRLKKQGIIPKYLMRYIDDWILLTTQEKEAERLVKYLNKYFKHRLKLELSEEKTIITNLTVKPAKFLGFLIKAGLPRKTPQNPTPKNIVGKVYPDMNKIKTEVKLINKEIRKLKLMQTTQDEAVQIEIVPLNILSNRPQRHNGYISKTYAIKHEGMYIGITKAFLTHSKWERYCFNQRITPYTKEGRKLYLQKYNNKKKLPLDRPPLYAVKVARSVWRRVAP